MGLLDDCVAFRLIGQWPHLRGDKLEGFNEKGQVFIEGYSNSYDYEFILEEHAGNCLIKELDDLKEAKKQAMLAVDSEFSLKLDKILRDYPKKRSRSHD